MGTQHCLILHEFAFLFSKSTMSYLFKFIQHQSSFIFPPTNLQSLSGPTSNSSSHSKVKMSQDFLISPLISPSCAAHIIFPSTGLYCFVSPLLFPDHQPLPLNSIISIIIEPCSNCAHFKTKQNPQLSPTLHFWITEFGCPFLVKILDTKNLHHQICSNSLIWAETELYLIN